MEGVWLRPPALSGLFHDVITCYSLQLLNVQLQAFACDTSLDHNYNNYVPKRRSVKMTSEGMCEAEMTWQVEGWGKLPWAVGVFPHQ